MRFLRLPSLIALIALASTLVPNVSFLLRFAALMLAALTILGALSDLQGATRRDAPTRDDLLKLWFGGKLREQHTWEALKADVAATASALRLPPPVSAPRPPNPRNNGNRRSDTLRLRAPSGTLKTSDQPTTAEATTPPADKRPKEALWPMLRLLANEALSECIVIATILLNWFKPAPGATAGEQLALLALGLLALGLFWFDWRLLRRFVAAVQHHLASAEPGGA